MSKKVVLITGASSGMGKETAKQLLSEGHTVYVAARRLEKMQDLANQGAIALKMDITKEEDILNVVETIKTNHGGVDVLVNNAGYGLYGAVEDIPIKEARYQFEVNIFGLARLTQLLIPHMREKQSGTIINISSVGGKVYTPLGAWYHATKHALEGWSDCLRIELESFNINVVIVEPGAILTEFGDAMTPSINKYSINGAYKDLAQIMLGVSKTAFEKGDGSPPSVISNTISKIIRSSKPKDRYAVGKYAKLLIFIRRWLGDRIFKMTISSMLKSRA